MFLQPFHSYLMARNWFSASVLLAELNILELWYYSLGPCPCWFFQNRATHLLCPDIINTSLFSPRTVWWPLQFWAFIYGFEPFLSPLTPTSCKHATQVTWPLIPRYGTNLYFLWQSSAWRKLSPNTVILCFCVLGIILSWSFTYTLSSSVLRASTKPRQSQLKIFTFDFFISRLWPLLHTSICFLLPLIASSKYILSEI